MRKVFVLLACACLDSACVPHAASSTEYTTHPMQLDNDDPDRNRVGRLDWRGGFEITSTDGRFGGLSGLHITADGRRLTAVGDRGFWFQAELRYREGRLDSLQAPALNEIKNSHGERVKGKNKDAESIAARDGREMLVSFERRHRIWRYQSTTSRAEPVAAPDDIRDLTNNGGVEATTYSCDGRLVLIAEKNKTRERHVQGWIQNNNGWESFTYNTVAGYRPTGAATLPNCQIMFLERSFSIVAGVSVRVTVVDAATLRAGASITPREIARFDFPVLVDNFEGIAARRSSTGETLVYILSDDNYNPLQRTLLLMFALTPPTN
jgi:hypothetical protein